MVYVEFLRARRSLTWHLGIMVLMTLVSLYFGHTTSVQVDGQSPFVPGMPVPLGQLATIAMFFGAIYASSAGTSLNRESLTRELSWTKPESRTLIALQYIAVDIAAIALVYAVAILGVVAVLLRLHFVPTLEPGFGADIALGLGVAVMWYALIQVLTCMFGPGARSVGGILWPVAFVALGTAHIGGPIGVVAHALDVINPLAYMSGVTGSEHGVQTNSLWVLPVDERALIVWLFGALFCAIAIALWPRKEA
jgi:hypothetical protein